MSRVGKKPITVPSGVEVTVNGKDVRSEERRVGKECSG